MKLNAVLLLIILPGIACAQEPWDIVPAMAESFCVGVPENAACKVPSPLNQRLRGVCCDGNCMYDVAKCGGKPKLSDEEVYDIFQKYTCREVPDGGYCDIPEEISRVLGYKVKGTCCSRLCRVGIGSCGNYCGDGVCTDQERKSGTCMEDCGGGGSWDICGDGICSDQERRGGTCMEDCMERGPSKSGRADDIPFEQQMKELELLACLGMEDGAKCNLPKDLETEFGLTGVCCSGKCNYRKTSCVHQTTTDDVEKPDLIVSSITVNPPNPTEDENVNVTVVVKNVGKAPTKENFWILLKIHDGGTLLTEENFEVRRVVEAGGSTEHTYTDKLGLGRIGSFSIKVDADMNSNFEHQSDLIDEADEGNNGGSKTLYVAPKGEEKVGGFCGDGICEEHEEGMCGKDCGMIDDGPGPREFMIVIAVLVFAVLAVLFFALRSRRSKPEAVEGREYTLEELVQRKKEIEEMTAIAKAKYHRRELDEESFREIVRDNQKKIIQLEIRMREVEGRVGKIEDGK